MGGHPRNCCSRLCLDSGLFPRQGRGDALALEPSSESWSSLFCLASPFPCAAPAQRGPVPRDVQDAARVPPR